MTGTCSMSLLRKWEMLPREISGMEDVTSNPFLYYISTICMMKNSFFEVMFEGNP